MKSRRGTGINKAFEITSVCKADILGLEKCDKNGYIKPRFNKTDIIKLTESDMRRIASKLANDYCEQLFWTSLEIIVEGYLENKKKYENSSN